jgi:hypothetical protein
MLMVLDDSPYRYLQRIHRGRHRGGASFVVVMLCVHGAIDFPRSHYNYSAVVRSGL